MNEQEIKLKVGSKIKDYRKALKLTQQGLGDIIGINQRQVALIETGKSFPMLSTMIKLANVFNCNVNDFFEFNIIDNQDEIKKQLISILDNCNKEQLEKIYSISKIIIE